MVAQSGKAGSDKGRKRTRGVTNRDLDERLEKLEQSFADMRVEVVKGLGEVEKTVGMLGTQVDTHLEYMNQQLGCQSMSLRELRGEVFGKDDSTGLKGRVQEVESRTGTVWKHVWAIWAAIGLGAIGVIMQWLKALAR